MHTAGAESDRVLLIGNGVAVGYGVLSHDLGLPGTLARRLTALTGRGTVVHVRANPDLTASGAAAHLSGIDVAKYDAIVTTLGGIEAVLLMSARAWADAIEAMIASMLDRAPTSGLYLVAVPLPESMVPMPWASRAITSRHARALNAITQEICSRYANATFVEFQPPHTRTVDDITSRRYRDWADLIAPPIAAGLDRHLDPDQVPVDEDLRIAALDDMRLPEPESESEVDVELDQIVATARDLFGASGAALNAIDRTRQWGLAAVGLVRTAVPRARSVCANTIASGEFFVVEDTDNDDSYSWSEWMLGEGRVRFYAGYPIEAPNGQRIGTLCVVDTKPRRFTATDRALLRELAMHAQSVLWNNYRGAFSR